MITEPALRLWRMLPAVLRQMIRFGSVSATALVVDVCFYVMLLGVVEPAALAAFVAYAVGGVWHYLLSSFYVFRKEMPDLRPLAQFARFIRYFGSALAGLAVTTGVVALLVDVQGLNPYLGKAVAIPLSFLTVFMMVRLLVFVRVVRAPAPMEPASRAGAVR